MKVKGVTPKIQCSHCGKQHYVGLFPNSNGITNVAHTWKTFGSAIYCPKCSKEIVNTSGRICDSYEVNIINIMQWINRRYMFVPREFKE